MTWILIPSWILISIWKSKKRAIGRCPVYISPYVSPPKNILLFLNFLNIKRCIEINERRTTGTRTSLNPFTLLQGHDLAGSPRAFPQLKESTSDHNLVDTMERASGSPSSPASLRWEILRRSFLSRSSPEPGTLFDSFFSSPSLYSCFFLIFML